MISIASRDDAPRAAVLLQAVFDDRVITVSGIRYRLESTLPEDRVRWWRAEVDGELVGWAFGGLDAFASARTAGFGGIVVHPAHRRGGIGSALWEVLTKHFDEIGVRRIVVQSQGDRDTSSFCAGIGFTLAATETASAVDPRTVSFEETSSPGIELAAVSQFADDPEPLFQADRESAQDEPGPSDFSGMSYQTWRRIIWDTPDLDRQLSVVALADSEIVGATFLQADREQRRAANTGTGVIRAYRGRGLGLLMKRRSLSWAAAAGITRVITQNDETNAPMLAINAQLGYRQFSVGHAWVLER